MEEKYDKIEKELEKIKHNSKSNQHQVFALRKMISGGSVDNQPEAIFDPTSKELLVDKVEILEATIKFASGTLQNNPPEEDFAEHFEEMKRRHAMRMISDSDEEEESNELTREDFDKELLSLKSKGKKVYNDVLKAGNGLKSDVFNFFSHIWKSEKIPSQWDLTTLMQVYKKGPKNCVDSYRYVHL